MNKNKMEYYIKMENTMIVLGGWKWLRTGSNIRICHIGAWGSLVRGKCCSLNTDSLKLLIRHEFKIFQECVC
jgi:hypothetical protein